ncbi:MAG: polyprenyl synthetase family protein [Alicyclobacillus sp.]|nr:polyprenyl synthetase family protein [Alicyclobacillus sp.]
MDFREVYKRYEADLEQVERLLRSAVTSSQHQLTTSAVQLLEAGGKRIRPLFAVLCSKLGQAPNPAHVHALAAALELIHMATLVHDDVIDDSEMRRGKPTVRAQQGDLAAMYTGDFLFARAIQLLAKTDSSMVHRQVSTAMVRMCEGEIEQIRDFFNWRQSIRTYLRRVERKTALLISVSCALGAAVSQASQSVVRRVHRFGYYTGMAFQITDDLLDYEGDERIVGKPVGGDLRQGNLTLPALQAATVGTYGRELRNLIRVGMSQEEVTRAVELVKESGALATARQIADRYLHKALACLDGLTPPDVRDELMVIAQFVNQRTH